MDDVIENAVERVIRAMQDNLGEPITIDDMARTAMFSKFHFSRIFQRVTGISPGRFLSALRLQEAKRLLLTSSMTVADISHVVGYNSIGTFSSRFRFSVGVPPTTYRQHGGYVDPLDEYEPAPEHVAGGRRVRVRGHIYHPRDYRPGEIVVGLFPERIAQSVPVSHVTLPASGEFVIDDVPEGSWHLLANSVENDQLDDDGDAYVAAFGPVSVRPEAPGRPVDLWLRRRRIFDPPALLAHLDQQMLALGTQASGRTGHALLRGA
jgi:AraC family transcriptional regulator